jgi:hypothetical protein
MSTQGTTRAQALLMDRPERRGGRPATGRSAAAAAAGITHATTRRRMLLSFTGLLPVALSIPVLLAHQYTLGIVANLALTAGVIGYHLVRRQGVTGLDALSLLFGVATAALHWGVHTDALMQHLDTVIYLLLLAQIARARLRGEAWTTQFARRSVDATLWTTAAFSAGNAFVSDVWGGMLVVCLLCSVAPVVSPLVHLWAPLTLLLGTGLLTPRLARWSGARSAARQGAGASPTRA